MTGVQTCALPIWATGQGVTETTDDKAGAEIAAVWEYVKGILNG